MSLSEEPPPRRILLEVCVDSVESAIIAEANGADRLELCANLAVGGGTTPSIGLVKSILRKVQLPIMVLIRCRTGDFVYSDAETEVMREDIRSVAELAATSSYAGRQIGVVVGALTPEGTVDVETLRTLIDAAGAMPITFHRAFDMVRDAEEVLHTLSSFGRISRILTSGLAPTCITGLSCLQQLTESAHSGNVRIMPGSGIKSSNVLSLLNALFPLWLAVAEHEPSSGPQGDVSVIGEVHLSAGAFQPPDQEVFRRDRMGFGLGGTAGGGEEWERREWGRWMVRAEELREVRRVVDRACAQLGRETKM